MFLVRMFRPSTGSYFSVEVRAFEADEAAHIAESSNLGWKVEFVLQPDKKN